MKRIDILLRITILATAVALIIGVYQKRTYTNYAQDGYPDNILVAGLNDGLSDIAFAKDNFSNAPIIVRVKVLEPIEYIGGVGRQLVEIEQNYTSNIIPDGNSIYICSLNWGITRVGDDKIPALSRHFVNLLNVDEEYLIFLDHEVSSPGATGITYQLYADDSWIAPVISYSEHTNKLVVPCLNDESTYGLYKDVWENEFFATTQEVLDAFIDMKEYYINKYPIYEKGSYR